MPLKVLTVDDSKTIRMIVKKAFRPYDCQLFEGENGVEGLAITAREKPDLIVLDITMPVMNGKEMLEKLKSEPALKEIPVIMLTAESGKDNVMEIVKMGVKDYMVKPFKGEQLIERVNKILKLTPKSDDKDDEDPASRYFSQENEIQVLRLPDKITRQVTVQIEGFLNARIQDRDNLSFQKLIINLEKVTEINVSLIKLIIATVNACQKPKIQVRLVSSPALGKELKEFQETSHLPIEDSMEAAKAALQ